MKTILIFFFTTLFSVCAIAQERALKVITYNIWNGYDWGKDEARRAKTNRWIAEQKPAVVTLQELCNYTPEKLAEDAQQWGHEYSVLLKKSGYSVGLTSHWPIEIKEKIIKGLHHGALHCKTRGIDVFVVHFSPSSYAKRREEAAIIIKKLEEVRKHNDRYMVLGDFNSHSPIDADLYDPDGILLNRLRASNKDKPLKGNLFHGNLDYAPISSFLAFPLMDVCQPYTKGLGERASFPGQVLGKVNNESAEQLLSRAERIDYILVSPELSTTCVDARVCNRQANYALSDHYPVVAEFELSN